MGMAQGRKNKNLAADVGVCVFFLTPWLKFSGYFLLVYKKLEDRLVSLTGLYYKIGVESHGAQSPESQV